MSNEKTTSKKLKQDYLERLKDYVLENKNMRLFFETISAFILIFIINFGLTLGESKIPIFDFIFNFNLAFAFWISTWTFLAVLFFEKTTISANFISLTISYKRKIINKKEYIYGGIFQFIGGFFAAIMVWFLVQFLINNNFNTMNNVVTMGGTSTKIKGLFFANYDGWSSWMPGGIVWDPITINDWYKYPFAFIQGLICAFFIGLLFLGNLFIDAKFKTGFKTKLWRYIILLICVSISSIFYANTSNWVRLLSPAIINQILSWINHSDSTMLYTTLIFISAQSIGIAFILVSKKFLDA